MGLNRGALWESLSLTMRVLQAVRRVGCSYEEMVCRIAEMTLD